MAMAESLESGCRCWWFRDLRYSFEGPEFRDEIKKRLILIRFGSHLLYQIAFHLQGGTLFKSNELILSTLAVVET